MSSLVTESGLPETDCLDTEQDTSMEGSKIHFDVFLYHDV